MKYRSKTIIEINQFFIKVAQTYRSNSNDVTFSETISVENANYEELVNRLSIVQKKLNLRESQIVLMLSRELIFFRYLDLPSQMKDELKVMIDLQISNHIPYSKEEIVQDFIPLGPSINGYTKVLVIIALKEKVLRLWKVLQDASMAPNYVTLSTIGLWEWFRQQTTFSKDPTILIDFGLNQSEICLLKPEEIVLSRLIPFGRNNELQQQELLKQIDTTINGSQDKVDFSPSKIIILSAENDQWLVTILKNKYGIPVELVVFKDNLASVFGLLKSNNINSVDLTPPDIKEVQNSFIKKRQRIKVVILGFFACLSMLLCLSLNLMKQKLLLNNLEKNLNNSKKQVALINQKENEIKVLTNLLANQVVVIDVIDEMYKLLPQGVTLTDLTLNKRDFSFQGFTTNPDDINKMQRAFNESGYLENIKLEYLNKRVVQDGEVNYFKFTCQIRSESNET